ncbi:hypothetical protein AB0L80_04155 [Streptomyces sp. NPDC052069]|uniref:hypothetical protein n=1 Tax=Streptomyces sp. NPDC052069 TaxID=3154650 RepID=UPI00342AC366
MAEQRLPDWQNLAMGTMVRAALWLVTQIGEGNVFVREQVHAAFPGLTQVDRRVRDLRDYGWVIHTHREDPTLSPGEQRFVSAGARVWEPGARQSVDRARKRHPEPARRAKPADAGGVWQLLQGLTAKERSLILAWMAIGNRPASPAEKAWRALRSLPEAERDELAARLGQLVISAISDEVETPG